MNKENEYEYLIYEEEEDIYYEQVVEIVPIKKTTPNPKDQMNLKFERIIIQEPPDIINNQEEEEIFFYEEEYSEKSNFQQIQETKKTDNLPKKQGYSQYNDISIKKALELNENKQKFEKLVSKNSISDSKIIKLNSPINKETDISEIPISITQDNFDSLSSYHKIHKENLTIKILSEESDTYSKFKTKNFLSIEQKFKNDEGKNDIPKLKNNSYFDSKQIINDLDSTSEVFINPIENNKINLKKKEIPKKQIPENIDNKRYNPLLEKFLNLTKNPTNIIKEKQNHPIIKERGLSILPPQKEPKNIPPRKKDNNKKIENNNNSKKTIKISSDSESDNIILTRLPPKKELIPNKRPRKINKQSSSQISESNKSLKEEDPIDEKPILLNKDDILSDNDENFESPLRKQFASHGPLSFDSSSLNSEGSQKRKLNRPSPVKTEQVFVSKEIKAFNRVLNEKNQKLNNPLFITNNPETNDRWSFNFKKLEPLSDAKIIHQLQVNYNMS